MTTATAKKAPAKKAAAPKPEPDETTVNAANDAALEWLLRQAFRHGQWAHVPTLVENAQLPDEVSAAVLAAYQRANV